MLNLRRSIWPSVFGGLFLCLSCAVLPAADGVWTNPEGSDLPADFQVQGEYRGKSVGAQVIALGDGHFQAVIYDGGLPGAGWDGKTRALFAGEMKDGSPEFSKADGNRKYLAANPKQFSASAQFPPEGHDQFESLKVDGKKLVVTDADGKSHALEKMIRQSKSMGMKPPKGAVVLFSGIPENMNQWNGGRYDPETNLLNTDGRDILTSDKFDDYTMHLEFLLPYKPKGRGQGRGNSGFYQVDHYEVQILDSFGLEGKNNECGGVYTIKEPDVNMCLPPLVWQTYDVEFTNARTNEDGDVTEPARLTVKHNGVTIHDDIELNKKTGGSRRAPMGTPGPIKLQGHGNPLQFRNVWILPKNKK
ncbi:3-keto-disaccharide hydrolase [Thalassoroseus pseudoceratinae]|uniref:3-keto-disaccharide hydrolase n=1 Tax=Thalassoroseus pseudoceratinae TaxID=2713176 RepID=UPI00141FC403|nr:DUF1080 domain-containing protein [Thalassoroseus pseudoceratinae]